MSASSGILIETFQILNRFDVKSILIGGQACVIYGAKTSTVDLDITVLAKSKNLEKLQQALTELEVRPSPLSVPIDAKLLSRGHSLHFYCHRAGFDGVRLDILGKLPRLDSFDALLERCFRYTASQGVEIPVLTIPDLILSKKTGRIKDYADITALVNSHFVMNKLAPEKSDIALWLQEAREVDVLSMFVEKFSAEARKLTSKRPLLKFALEGDITALKVALIEEASREATEHEEFRAPLRLEAKELSRQKRKLTKERRNKK